ncbi:ABC transporter family protein [Gammaproteobacteria bacterium SCGC AG-212-F23]|nr:ABC transporter family protein [Gammaproteobacteria bacterium SCGC AG-212-F23]
MLAMTISIVGLEVVFNNWYNLFYNALQDYDKRGSIDLVFVFLFLASIFIIISVYRYYAQQMLGLRWRRWLTHQFLTRWLERKSYYYLENFDEHTDNPDQRIQEDINAIVAYSLDLSIGLISAIATFFAFIYILWKLSGVADISLGSFGVLHIPGYLVWIGVLYALFGTFCTFKIGRPLVSLNFEQQRREANFRFAAVDLRSHSENVALYRGEAHEKGVLNRLFGGVLENWYAIILRQKLLLWFTAGYNQISVILPLLAALPNYFGRIFKLGGLMQTLSAFRQIQEALSFIVNSYTTIALWQAVTRRLLTFLNHMHTIEEDAVTKNKFIFTKNPQRKIQVKNLNVDTPQGEKLLENITREFDHGKNYLIKGASGIGKSTFVRALAGIWPYGSGEICLPESNNIMYIPQKPYMPLGSLREALLFPDHLPAVSDNALRQLLVDCDLPDLVNELHHVTAWSDHLSPGEQQRIAFVRIFLHHPDWLFLDESTSALDLKHEQQLYHLLKSRLPQCSLITVGHQPSLEPFHEEIVDFTEYGRVVEVQN